MPRDIPVGNGNLLVAFDRRYRIRELTFPYVGLENHTAGEAFRLGFWADGSFSWVGDDGWHIDLDYLDDTLVSAVTLENRDLGLRVTANDLVDFQENVFLRRMTVENRTDRRREVRVFFHHDFHIYGSLAGDTANYQPDTRSLYHFKERRCFYIGAAPPGRRGFDDYATGNKEIPKAEGTWRDAEDGRLSRNPIAQGAVDSVGAVHLDLGPAERQTFDYWICAGHDWHEVTRLDAWVRDRTPGAVLRRTADYWRLWVAREELNEGLLPARVFRLYKRSLLIARTQIDNRGGILAGVDSDTLDFNRDTYNYVWPRDGALAAFGLDLAGYDALTRSFFDFCGRVIHDEGYFLHKYTPTGAEGSSWQPWYDPVLNEPQLPIQEDEIALVIWALWNHFDMYRDVEFSRALYDPLVKRGADFMLGYRDARTGLPLPSYDLWEERRGVLTYTVSAVYGGLRAAASFAEAFSESDLAESYRRAAEEIKAGLVRHLWLPDRGRFARLVNFRDGGGVDVDDTLDASLFALCGFGILPPDDDRVESTMRQVQDRLWIRTGTGGLARYEGDVYHRARSDIPGNPWIVTTMWLARYKIMWARTPADLRPALDLLEWAADRALPSGVLAEQLDPVTSAPLSVSPLSWSHTAFVAVVQEYLNTLVDLERCPACGRPRLSKYKPRRLPTSGTVV